ncbi:unnamed protein product [Eruca vesicaria subsp. sativa]|uniref:Uncharacterized protein n=1 Tax=Eruca vesicaria subsp. sativa TaxID=29727 RepID=A0ABC8K487_ERUVS|nr:unnamed protein product [Eruca vesicaria subsp. sativa]
MELKKLFMAFFITTTVVTFVYPSFGQKNIDDEPLVNPGRDMDAVKAISPASQDYNLDLLENLPTKYKMYIGTCMNTMESDLGIVMQMSLKRFLRRNLFPESVV